MDGNVTANLTVMPISNLIIILVGIVVIMIIAAILIKKFNLSVSKGSIKVADYEADQSCQTTMYYLQETIDNIDYETRASIRRQTKLCNYKIAKIGSVGDMCQTARRSLFYSFKEPFFDYINANHFTREFRPDNIESYKANLLENIHEIHQGLAFEYKLDDCDRNEMDGWDAVAPAFEQLVDEWLLMAMTEVKKACARKIKVYEQILPEMTKSKHWEGILKGCIEKNNGYISNINQIIKDMQK